MSLPGVRSRGGGNLRRSTSALLACWAMLLAAGCRVESPERDGRESTARVSPAPEIALASAPFQMSAVTLTGLHEGRPTAWSFERIAAELRLRGGQPTRLSLSIDVGSVVASAPALRSRLGREDMLDPSRHATARFTSTLIRASAGEAGSFSLTGELALAGRTHVVTLPATLARGERGWVLRTRAALGAPAWAVAFAGPHGAVFDDRLALEARLVFPEAPPRARRGLPTGRLGSAASGVPR